MSNVSGLGLSPEKWETMVREQQQATIAKTTGRSMATTSSTSSLNTTEAQEEVLKDKDGILGFLHSSNTCTDGKDDGKIGFLSATANIAQGAVKGLVNGIVGCFTNKEGKFSLGKTVLSLAAAGVCIAFPAVGFAACAIGAVSGGAKVIGGIKNALGAKSDAQAKDAFEAIGDGAFTTASSIVGAKASYKAIGKSSTGAIDDVVKNVTKGIDKTDDGIRITGESTKAIKEALKNSNVKNKKGIVDKINKAANEKGATIEKVTTLAKEAITDNWKGSKTAIGNLDKLDDSATIGEKISQGGKFAKALGKDMISSTKNNGAKLGAELSAIKDSRKITKNEAKIENNNKKLSQKGDKKLNKDQKAALEEQNKALSETNAKISEKYQNNGKEELLNSKIEKQNNKIDTKKELANNVEEAKQNKNDLKEILNEAKKTKNKTKIEKASKAYNEAKTELKTAQREQMLNKTGLNKLVDTANNSNTGKYIKEHMPEKAAAKAKKTNVKGFSNKVTNLKSNLETMRNNVTSIDYKGFLEALSDDGKAIVDFLTTTNGSYAQAVQKYGYQNVLEVMEVYIAYNTTEKTAA